MTIKKRKKPRVKRRRRDEDGEERQIFRPISFLPELTTVLEDQLQESLDWLEKLEHLPFVRATIFRPLVQRHLEMLAEKMDLQKYMWRQIEKGRSGCRDEELRKKLLYLEELLDKHAMAVAAIRDYYA